MVPNDPAALARAIAVHHAMADAESAGSLTDYLSRVVIESVPPCAFGDVAEPWQWSVYGPIDAALEQVAGVRSDYGGPRAFWRGLPKGHDKTSSIARRLNWLLAYARRPLNLYCVAADADQAGLITQAMAAERRLNPWLAARTGKGQSVVRGPGGFLQVLAADAGSNQGLKPDVVVADELTVWERKAGYELWTAILSGMEKRPNSVLIVISNAGVKFSWQHHTFLKARDDPDWDVYESPERVQLASWMTPERIDKLREKMLPSEGRRLFDNVWIDPGEESGYLTRADAQLCESRGAALGLTYRTRGERGKRYWASIDYGPKRDRTALAVCHPEEGGLVVLDRLDVWQWRPYDPDNQGQPEIRIARIREWLEEVDEGFGRPDLVLDPYQLLELAQDERRRRIVETFEARGGKNTYRLCECFRDLVVNGKLAWYPGAGTLLVNGHPETFVDEVAALVFKQMSYGYRFDHESGFHDDRAVAVGMAALMCVEHAQPAWTPPLPIEKAGPTPHWEQSLPPKPTAGFMGMQSPGDIKSHAPHGFLKPQRPKPAPRFLG
jgi:hypothetical protein